MFLHVVDYITKYNELSNVSNAAFSVFKHRSGQPNEDSWLWSLFWVSGCLGLVLVRVWGSAYRAWGFGSSGFGWFWACGCPALALELWNIGMTTMTSSYHLYCFAAAPAAAAAAATTKTKTTTNTNDSIVLGPADF